MTNDLSDLKKCPFCAEDIKAAAIVCKHCQRDLPDPTAGQTAAKPAAPPDPKLFGRCAQCDGMLLLTEENCPHCKANYGVHSLWKKQPLDYRAHAEPIPTLTTTTAAPPKKFRWWLWIPLGALGIFIVFAIIGSNDPQIQAMGHARTGIAQCWAEQQRKSLTPGAQRFVAGACEAMEKRFVDSFGRAP